MQKRNLIITPEIISQCEKMAARGLDYEQIAMCLGVSLSTLKRLRKRREKFEEAIQRGRSKGLLSVANALYERAIGGETTAMIFYLKSRDPARWHERHTLFHSGPSGGPIEVVSFTPEQADSILRHMIPEYAGETAVDHTEDID